VREPEALKNVGDDRRIVHREFLTLGVLVLSASLLFLPTLG